MKAYELLLLMTVASCPIAASAHDAPSGWSYDASCCSSIDCRQIPSSTLSERPTGYVISISNETVPYGDTRIKNSPDGLVHWCTINGRDDARTICLYVPPRSY
jgi:hypothetical protein